MSNAIFNKQFRRDGREIGQCTAWVVFNGQTLEVLDSLNVSGVTSLSTGNFQINYETNMDNSSYSASLSVKLNSEEYTFSQVTCSEYRYPESRSISFIRVNSSIHTSGGYVATSPELYMVQVFGGID